jgi:hypothetical protein
MRRAAVISLILNVLVISILVHFYRRPDFEKERQSTAEIVTIVKAPPHPIARKRVAKAAAAAPPRVVAKVPVEPVAPQPAPVHHLLSVPRKHATVAEKIEPKALPEPRVVHKHVPPAVVASLQKPAPVAAAPRRLTASQIADIESNLGASIAHDRDRVNPLNGTETTTVPTERHYGPDLSGLTTGGINHHGLCSPIKSWTDQGWDYYYLTCNVRSSDGTFDEESIPWPVRYRPDHDPNLGTAPDGQPIAMPLPGWHLPPGEPVADGVRAYAEEHGVSL